MSKMKLSLIFLYSISVFCLANSWTVSAQTPVKDSIEVKERYGLRLGVDLSKPLRSFLQEDYQGFEVLGDYRVYKNYYIAGELGNEQLAFSEGNLSVSSKGSYIKLGADYNAYDNWAGMENIIFIGLRYGFATFSQTLEQYSIYSSSNYFEPVIIEEPEETKGLSTSWAELMVGLKVEVIKNVYLGANVQLKRRVSQTTPSNMDNLIVPGFNRTYDDSTFGVGYGYNISYLIPLYKKAKD
jgi:hypothetical protein